MREVEIDEWVRSPLSSHFGRTYPPCLHADFHYRHCDGHTDSHTVADPEHHISPYAYTYTYSYSYSYSYPYSYPILRRDL